MRSIYIPHPLTSQAEEERVRLYAFRRLGCFGLLHSTPCVLASLKRSGTTGCLQVQLASILVTRATTPAPSPVNSPRSAAHCAGTGKSPAPVLPPIPPDRPLHAAPAAQGKARTLRASAAANLATRQTAGTSLWIHRGSMDFFIFANLPRKPSRRIARPTPPRQRLSSINEAANRSVRR